MGTVVGYARVSTLDQTPALQLDALKAAECDRIIEEYGSGSKTNPRLARLLVRLHAGDTLVVWKLDRLGRSTSDLIVKLNDLHARGIAFRSVRDNIDTTSATGKLMFHILASFAEFERDLIIERTKAGLATARAKGKRGGRPCKLSAEQKSHVRDLVAAGDKTIGEIARLFQVDRATVHRILRT
jgi:DNA invertase Pin-like site-specific DNA recombinase